MRNKKLLLMPMLLIASYWALISIAMPIFPYLSSVLKTSPHMIHLIVSLALMISGLSTFIWGIIIDSIEFRAFLIITTIATIIIVSLTAIAMNVWFFALTFIISCTTLAGFIVFGRSFPLVYLKNDNDIKQSFFLIVVGCYIISIIGPLIGGQIDKFWGWRFVFTTISLWLIVLLLFIIPLTKPIIVKNRCVWQNVCQSYLPLKNKVFVINTLIAFFTTVIMGSYCVAFPFWIASSYKVSATTISYYLLPILLPGAILPLLANYMQKNFGDDFIFKFYLLSSILAVVIAFILGFLPSPPLWIWTIPGILTTAAGTYIIPVACCRALKSVADHQHTASGLFSVSIYLSGGIGVYITTFISLKTFYYFATLILLTACINTICWLYLKST